MDRVTAKRLAALMTFPELMNMYSGPYFSQMPYIPKRSKHRSGTITGCCKCGSTNTTLYKCGYYRVCKNCKDRDAKKKNTNDGATLYNAAELKFYKVLVLNEPMIFTDLRIDDRTIPDGMYMYEVKHADGLIGTPVEICRHVDINSHYGTLISTVPIGLDIESESYSICADDICLIGMFPTTLADYAKRMSK